MFEVKNFKIERQRKASHEGATINLTHERTRSKRKETNGKGAKKRQRFSKIVLEVGERKTRGEWQIM